MEDRPTVASDPDGRFLWFVVAAAVIISALTVNSAANAPTNAEEAAHAEKAITDTEYAAHVAVNATTLIAGGGAGASVLESTGSRVLAGGAEGLVAGGTSAPLNRAVSDVSQGHTSTPKEYAKDAAVGAAVGLGLGTATGGISRLVRGPVKPTGSGFGSSRGGGSPAKGAVRVRSGIRAGSAEGGGSTPPKSGGPGSSRPTGGSLSSEAPTPPLGVRTAPQISNMGGGGIRAEWGPNGGNAVIQFEQQGKGVILDYIRVSPSFAIKGPQLLADALKASGIARPESIESSAIINPTLQKLLASGSSADLASAERMIRVSALTFAKALGATLKSADLVKNKAGNWVAKVALSY